MTVALAQGRILITGQGAIEDAETLLLMLRDPAATMIVVEGCGRLSTAVVQLLMACSLPMSGTPADPFMREQVLPAIRRARRYTDAFENAPNVL